MIDLHNQIRVDLRLYFWGVRFWGIPKNQIPKNLDTTEIALSNVFRYIQEWSGR